MFRRKRLFPRSSNFWDKVNLYRAERRMVRALKPVAIVVMGRLTKNKLLAECLSSVIAEATPIVLNSALKLRK